MSQPLTLMAVHAHPDDETIGTGGVLARAAAEGIRTVLVTCTGGEVGEIAPETGATLETLERGPRTRATSGVQDPRRHPSGTARATAIPAMIGTADNANPASFFQADLGVATARLADLVRKYPAVRAGDLQRERLLRSPGPHQRPPHPVGAYDLAADEGHNSARPRPVGTGELYYTAVARSAMKQFGQRLRELGIDAPMRADSPTRTGQAEEPPWGTAERELITTLVDVSDQVEQKRLALDAHATQIGPGGVLREAAARRSFTRCSAGSRFRLVRSGCSRRLSRPVRRASRSSGARTGQRGNRPGRPVY